MLKLYILRHGKAVKPEEASTDFKRNLNKKGIAQVNQVGYILKNEKIQIDQLISSTAKRTEETTEIANFHIQCPKLHFDKDLYLASKNEIIKILKASADGENILLIGHNFGLSDVVNYLTGNNLLLSTSMLVQINFNFDDWSLIGASTGEIKRIIEPQVHSF